MDLEPNFTIRASIQHKIKRLKQMLRESREREAKLQGELAQEKALSEQLRKQLEAFTLSQAENGVTKAAQDCKQLLKQNSRMKHEIAELRIELSYLERSVQAKQPKQSPCKPSHIRTQAHSSQQLRLSELMVRYETVLKENTLMKADFRSAKLEYQRVIRSLLEELEGHRKIQDSLTRELR